MSDYMNDQPGITGNKLINALNYTPVDYKHADGIPLLPDDILNDAREKVAMLKAPDELNSNYLDSYIDKVTDLDISGGREQYIKHLGSVRSILESVKDEGVKANELLPKLEEELAGILSKLEYYRSLEEI